MPDEEETELLDQTAIDHAAVEADKRTMVLAQEAADKQNTQDIHKRMKGLFYTDDDAVDNEWAPLTIDNLKASVVMMNQRYLKNIIKSVDTKEEKIYLDRLEAELARRQDEIDNPPPEYKPVSLFKD